jgi:hypothetical protein
MIVITPQGGDFEEAANVKQLSLDELAREIVASCHAWHSVDRFPMCRARSYSRKTQMIPRQWNCELSKLGIKLPRSSILHPCQSGMFGSDDDRLVILLTAQA